jgi:hypothetical protein
LERIKRFLNDITTRPTAAEHSHRLPADRIPVSSSTEVTESEEPATLPNAITSIVSAPLVTEARGAQDVTINHINEAKQPSVELSTKLASTKLLASKPRRSRRHAAGLIALGFREQKWHAHLKWVFGVPSMRQVKKGIRVTLRTPSRLIEFGQPAEIDLCVLETDDKLASMSDKQLEYTAMDALHTLAVEKLGENIEVRWIKVLPLSRIAKLLRGRQSKALIFYRRVFMIAKCTQENNTLLAEVSLNECEKRAYVNFQPIPTYPAYSKSEAFSQSLLVHEDAAELMSQSFRRTRAIVKETLEANGFQVLMMKVPHLGRKKQNAEKAGPFLRHAPWDFVHVGCWLKYVDSKELLHKKLIPVILEAPVENRGYILKAAEDIWPFLHRRNELRGRESVEIPFRFVKPWLMPYERCDDIDSFKEAYKSVAQCFEIDLWDMEEHKRLFRKALHWWLYRDACHYLLNVLLSEKTENSSDEENTEHLM